MSLPGFTAEVSLESTGRTYRGVSGRSDNSDGQTVVAAQLYWYPDTGCGADCLRRDWMCNQNRDHPHWSERECNRQFTACIQECPGSRRRV